MTSKYSNYEFHLGCGPLVRVQALTPLDARAMEVGGTFIKALGRLDSLIETAERLPTGEGNEELLKFLYELRVQKVRSKFVPWYVTHNQDEKVANFWSKEQVIVVMAESGVDAYLTIKSKLGITATVWHSNLESTGKTEICANYEQIL